MVLAVEVPSSRKSHWQDAGYFKRAVGRFVCSYMAVKLCTRILIENSKIKFDGKTADTFSVYQKKKII
jgi:hypothetical protein